MTVKELVATAGHATGYCIAQTSETEPDYNRWLCHSVLTKTNTNTVLANSNIVASYQDNTSTAVNVVFSST